VAAPRFERGRSVAVAVDQYAWTVAQTSVPAV
jgi:hypothetical protein